MPLKDKRIVVTGAASGIGAQTVQFLKGQGAKVFEDIAPVIAFLCSDWSNWIRGANIPCDGGMYQHVLCNMYGFE